MAFGTSSFYGTEILGYGYLVWNLSSQIDTSNCQVTVNNILIRLGMSRIDDIPTPNHKRCNLWQRNSFKCLFT